MYEVLLFELYLYIFNKKSQTVIQDLNNNREKKGEAKLDVLLTPI